MTAVQTPATSARTRTTWQIDPAHTSVEFAVKHMMITTVKGRFTDVSGTVVADEAEPTRSTVEATMSVATIDTRAEQRDGHLRSADFFDVEKYPTITFTSRRIEGDPTGAFRLVGDLTIRGVTKEVTLDVTNEGRGRDPWGGERAGFSATTKINRKDFGLTWNQALETGGVLVGDDVKISIEVELVKQQ